MGFGVFARYSDWRVRCRDCRFFLIVGSASITGALSPHLVDRLFSSLHLFPPPHHHVTGQRPLTADPPQPLPLAAETVRIHSPQRAKPSPGTKQQHSARIGLSPLPLRILVHRQPLPRIVTHFGILPCQRQRRRQWQWRTRLSVPAVPIALSIFVAQLTALPSCQAPGLQLHRAVVTCAVSFRSTGIPCKDPFCTSSRRASRVAKTKLHFVGCRFPPKPHWHAGTQGRSAECRDE